MRFLSTSFPIILAVCLAVFCIAHFSLLPVPPQSIAAEKYAGFSGVLTISFSESIREQFPGLKQWLTDITNLFEKRNTGIYLRCTDSPVLDADILICTTAEAAAIHASPVPECELLPAFSIIDGAIPIAADGYVLGIHGNPSETLQNISFAWHPDLATAWVGLCEGFSPLSTRKSTVSAPDIGLSPSETPIPTSEPAVGTVLTQDMAVESDFSAFLASEILAMPLTGNQVAKIRAGQSEGKYSDIRFLNAASYTDRVPYAVIPSSPRADGELRASAARAFIKMLTEEDAQNRLKKYHFFPTGITENLYEGVPGMAEIESALRRTDCVVNLSLTNDEIEAFWNGEISARELMRRLRNAPRPAAKLQ